MVRTPYSDKSGLRKGTWTPEEDRKLLAYVTRYGCWNWRQLPKYAGLARCGKSCRLRWMNYLRPNIKRGNYSEEEEETIIRLHESLGNKWSAIAAQLPGRTDNEIKNHWHTNLKKRFQNMPSSSDGKDKTNTQDQNKHKEREFGTKPSDCLVMEPINITPPLILESSLSSPQSASSDQNSSITTVSSEDPVSDNLSTDNNMAKLEDLELVNSGSFWTEPFFSDSFYVDSASYDSQFEILDGEMISCPSSFYDQLGNFNF